ncbi:MAG: capsule biosynthesis protein CapD [Planctomycetaceae bacterium]|nr:capsule biosynthesis protein CapD [Planctomycetaceae bacterium]
MKRRLAILIPVYLVTYSVCYYVAFLLRFDFSLSERYVSMYAGTLPVVLLLKLSTNIATSEWRRRFRYTSIRDVFNLFVGSSAAAVLLFCANVALFSEARIPRSVILIDWTLAMLAIGVLRMLVRVYREQVRILLRGHDGCKRTLIFRSDKNSIGILRTLQATSSDFQVVAFVDPVLRGASAVVSGVPVYAEEEGWARLAKKLRAHHVLIPSSVPGKVVRALVSECSKANLKTHIIPTVPELADGRYKVSVRDVTISDLLRREPAELDRRAIRQYVSNKRVLVTGGAGSIGSELCRQLIRLQPAELVLVDQSEFGVFTMQQELSSQYPDASLCFAVADVTDRSAMARIFESHTPQLVFHAAAYKHVPLMEDNPLAAVHNNVLGTKVVVDLSGETGVERFVFISTDKAVRPSNVMGSTKLVAEKYVQAGSRTWDTQYMCVRFGNVLNSAGSVVPTFRKQIELGGPISVTHPEMERFFMTIPEAVQLVLQAGAIGSSGDVLILEMGEPVKILDLAKDLISLSGLHYPDDIDIVFSGIRPGEKLQEELFYHCEEGTKKVHDKIFCASRKAPRLVDVHRNVNRVLESNTDDDVKQILTETVSAFVDADRATPRIRRAA